MQIYNENHGNPGNNTSTPNPNTQPLTVPQGSHTTNPNQSQQNSFPNETDTNLSTESTSVNTPSEISQPPEPTNENIETSQAHQETQQTMESTNNNNPINQEQPSIYSNKDTSMEQKEQTEIENKKSVWDLFQYKIENKHEYRKPTDYPRKPMMIDSDLCTTLREIDIENVSPTNLLNTIVRSFIETYLEELSEYRKIQAPSVFQMKHTV